jgi:hypothetical protein
LENVKVGDPVPITVTLTNVGICAMVGLPQYTLTITPNEAGPILTPENPDPVIHDLGLYPGEMDSVEFILTSVSAGQATITAYVSYEVNLGYPGPAYWGGNASQAPLVITVGP